MLKNLYHSHTLSRADQQQGTHKDTMTSQVLYLEYCDCLTNNFNVTASMHCTYPNIIGLSPKCSCLQNEIRSAEVFCRRHTSPPSHMHRSAAASFFTMINYSWFLMTTRINDHLFFTMKSLRCHHISH